MCQKLGKTKAAGVFAKDSEFYALNIAGRRFHRENRSESVVYDWIQWRKRC